MPTPTSADCLPLHRMTRADAMQMIADPDLAATMPIWFREIAWLTARNRRPAAQLGAWSTGGDAA